jgi:2-keto-3-deoxy-6-phosphogluconate aldolase
MLNIRALCRQLQQTALGAGTAPSENTLDNMNETNVDLQVSLLL